MQKVEVKLIEPLTEVELSLLDFVAIGSSAIGLLCCVVVLGVTVYASMRTTMPGRHTILISFLCLCGFFAYESYMGGNLEYVFGPIGNLYKTIAYALIFVSFSFGYLKLAKYFIREKNH